VGAETHEELGYDDEPDNYAADEDPSPINDPTLGKYPLESMEKIVHAYFVDKVGWDRLYKVMYKKLKSREEVHR